MNSSNRTHPVNEEHFVATESDMTALGQQLQSRLPKPAVVTLSGELGAGKSVLARSVIRACGHSGAVKSPTYTLVEQYALPQWRISHLDLYRLADPEELLYLGFDDIVANSDLLLIEWPDKGGNLLPNPTLEVTIAYGQKGRVVSLAGSLLAAAGV